MGDGTKIESVVLVVKATRKEALTLARGRGIEPVLPLWKRGEFVALRTPVENQQKAAAWFEERPLASVAGSCIAYWCSEKSMKEAS